MKNPLANAVFLLAALTMLGALDIRAGHAQEARGGGGAVSAQLVAELQQLSAERTSLKAENAQLKQQLAAAENERDALKKGEQATGARVKSSEAALARSNVQEAESQQKIGQMQAAMQQACCRGLNVDLHPRESGAGLDYETLADGTRRLRRNPDDSCVHVVDGMCTVYGIRPQTCRVFDCRDNAVTGCVTLAQERPLTEAILRWRPEFKTYEDRAIFARLHGQVRELHRRQPALHALELAARVVKDDVKIDFLKDGADVGRLLWI